MGLDEISGLTRDQINVLSENVKYIENPKLLKKLKPQKVYASFEQAEAMIRARIFGGKK